MRGALYCCLCVQYETPKQLMGVPRGKAVNRRRRASTGKQKQGWGGADVDENGLSEFQVLWRQLSTNGWRARVIKRPRVKKPYAGHEVGGGETPLGMTWRESDPYVLEESYVRPGRWGPGERASSKLGVDYFSSPHNLQAFLRRCVHTTAT
eukprot:COSAG06_NODE_6545_length_2887_cov_2.501793_4_plen_151_part_00